VKSQRSRGLEITLKEPPDEKQLTLAAARWSDHRNLKSRSRIMPWKVKKDCGVKKSPRYEQPNTYITNIKYCVMEIFCGTIQFMIWYEVGRSDLCRAHFTHFSGTFWLLVFRFLWIWQA
jgi:hypothetical protein